MPIYHKLVRDNVPEIIKRSGKRFSVNILSNEEYRDELSKKLVEEMNEYANAKDIQEAISELADIMEVILATTEILGFSKEQLEEISKMKAEKNGGFKKRIF